MCISQLKSVFNESNLEIVENFFNAIYHCTKFFVLETSFCNVLLKNA